MPRKYKGSHRPRIGILSNGEEESKGNDLTRAASEVLSTTSLNYIGYVEGRDVFNGKVDVIVCDGFTGKHSAQDYGRSSELCRRRC